MTRGGDGPLRPRHGLDHPERWSGSGAERRELELHEEALKQERLKTEILEEQLRNEILKDLDPND